VSDRESTQPTKKLFIRPTDLQIYGHPRVSRAGGDAGKRGVSAALILPVTLASRWVLRNIPSLSALNEASRHQV
jgi:hypothetical protein